MKFVEGRDPLNTLHRVVTDTTGKIVVGICVVMHGYRIRAGFAGAYQYELDWCGGDDPVMVNMLYGAMVSCLEKRDVTDPFRGMPICSERKPFHMDVEFMKFLEDEVKGRFSLPDPLITTRDLSKYRLEQMRSAFG